MRDTSELTVVMLSDKAWERLELVAITEPVPLDQWLGWVRDERMRVSAEPYSRIEGGEYDGVLPHVRISPCAKSLPHERSYST